MISLRTLVLVVACAGVSATPAHADWTDDKIEDDIDNVIDGSEKAGNTRAKARLLGRRATAQLQRSGKEGLPLCTEAIKTTKAIDTIVCRTVLGGIYVAPGAIVRGDIVNAPMIIGR
jgi:hypothetical protein